MAFNEWINTLVKEKELDTEQIFEVTGPVWGINFIPLGNVIEAIKSAPIAEQRIIKLTLIEIDFCDGDITHFFKHLAQAIAI